MAYPCPNCKALVLTLDECCPHCAAPLPREEQIAEQNHLKQAKRPRKLSWFWFCVLVAFFPLAISLVGALLSSLLGCAGEGGTLYQRLPPLQALVQYLVPLVFLLFWTVPTGVVLFVVGALLLPRSK